MKLKIGIDVGGTFTDFLVTGEGGNPRVYKILSTPGDPSLAVIEGLGEIAESMGVSLGEVAGNIETIVHGTTVTTNAVLTLTGAKTGLLTTDGVRDALEMRRGIREEQYNNRYTNVPPLVPRYLRIPIRGRLNYRGEELTPLEVDDIQQAMRLFKEEGVEAIAICFMNSFANPQHEHQAAEYVLKHMEGAFLSVSCDVLPAIRFYDRVSTTVLNSYVGPKLNGYIRQLISRLKEVGFAGVLLVMQSSGGVMSPDTARKRPALTLLSGPAAGPKAGFGYAHLHGHDSCITMDMGGTSFDAALVRGQEAVVATEGEINRYRIALPMLDIVTIGAGGGSIAWLDEGGMLRVGPQSAGADPGPVCYGKGGTLPTCTDADLVLGYLAPEFFAGGKIKLDARAASEAIELNLAGALGLSVDQTAAGIYRVINTNMAQGVREISVKRGLDPREFPLIAAGGAGPLHACMICQELEIPFFIVPRESSIFCAAGMLMSDLQHDFVRSFVARLDQLDWKKLRRVVDDLIRQGTKVLADENIPAAKQRLTLHLDCRYVKQYHEVSFPSPVEDVHNAAGEAIADRFHAEHERMYGYSLRQEGTPIELINVLLRAVGVTEKPAYPQEPNDGSSAQVARKGQRKAYLPEERQRIEIPVYDGHRTRHGHCIAGPALIEQVNTTLLITSSFDCVCDSYGSFIVFKKGMEGKLSPALQEMLP